MKVLIVLLFFIPSLVFAAPLYSPTWGFRLDLPLGYELIDGDGRDRFSFSGPGEAMFDIVVYNDVYESMEALVNDVNRRLSNQGGADFFYYNGRQAAIIELTFGNLEGWALAVELAMPATGIAAARPPILLALAYGPAGRADLQLFHMSALDSIIPSDAEQFFPGPIMEYAFPRGDKKQVTLAVSGVTATIHENDAEAARVLIEREFNLLMYYVDTPVWREAWVRYYRLIYRDSFDRVADAAAALVRHWGGVPSGNEAQRAFAARALTFVQGFEYERNFAGSDFLNLVTAITEGRGDCDNRAMLWAIILAKADIRSAMMISRFYSHAMGLADIAGAGARFEAYGTRWLVAETTDNVDIGLIAQDKSDPQYWIGVIFK